MTVSRVGTLLFPAIESTRDQATCVAELGQALSGKARYLYELAAGESAVTGEDPVTPPNPQGLTGVDLSGPPWGSALLRPLALFGSGTANNANIQARTSSVLVAATDGLATVTLRLWVRPHARLPSGYAPPEGSPILLLRAYASSGTPTLTVQLVSGGNPGSSEAVVSTDSLTMSTTETNFATSCQAFFAPVGGMQEVHLQARVSAGTATITAAALVVATKRGQ